MNLDDLRAVQADERSTDSLQPLPDSFYRDVADYISALREERARAAERAEDPFGSDEVRHLTDEIETAEEVAEAIYDRRLGKVVKRASLAAAGMPSDEEGLTDEESALFSDLIDQIESHRGSVLSAFSGEGSTGGNASETRDAPAESAPIDESRSTPPGTDAGTPDVLGGDTSAPADSDAPAPAEADTPGDVDAGEPIDAGAAAHSDQDSEDRVDPEPAPDLGGDASPGTEFDASDAMGGAAENVRERADETGDDATTGPTPGAADEPRTDAPPATGGGTEDDGAVAEPDGPTPDGGRLAPDRTTVRITRDIGEIMGIDEHVYELAAEDVVTLPEANAEPLLSRDAASRIE